MNARLIVLPIASLAILTGCAQNFSSTTAPTSAKPIVLSKDKVTKNNGMTVEVNFVIQNNETKAISLSSGEFALLSNKTVLSPNSQSQVPQQIPAQSTASITLDFTVDGKFSGKIEPRLAYQPSINEAELFMNLGTITVPTAQPEIVPLINIQPSQVEQGVVMYFTNVPQGYFPVEVTLSFFNHNHTSSIYTEKSTIKNGQWLTANNAVSNITAITQHSDGTMTYDFPNGNVGNDAQISVIFKDSSGDSLKSTSTFFNLLKLNNAYAPSSPSVNPQPDPSPAPSQNNGMGVAIDEAQYQAYPDINGNKVCILWVKLTAQNNLQYPSSVSDFDLSVVAGATTIPNSYKDVSLGNAFPSVTLQPGTKASGWVEFDNVPVESSYKLVNSFSSGSVSFTAVPFGTNGVIPGM